ncbi:indole-3-glycerol phosphate synthase [Corynebacterium hadale]|uniref:indole-3-glycerol-phosphate synthase n=2 Tax=Corynebacterium TaxID=1716 RepID=A0A269PD20_9CORY|nr:MULTISPECIES: indole-3-glycerol phosphate synthase [Corynebacterium]MCG7254402.1 indole-3-glycerol-phosphate synthase TrpC [Corynebacterium hadale]MCG7256612.1 indole-3-glycerol-phosphate synthase TrpC [Corynebacterium hadale]MCG7264156.1 indole-3-glycerol-phosphate synthase TrpC [Corynebacterium hadale]PAJ69721.1 indole-3-glycerol phosphate synthase [Corynebacterium hadale]PAT03515.1 indole-3-glycerol phosphate synthase [Corynebacterium sp. NML 150383]
MLAPHTADAPDKVNTVVASVLRDVAKRESVVSFQDIKARSRAMAPTRDAKAALLRHGCGVVAEIKRNSPVFGPTAATYQSIEEVAHAIEQGGAHLIACQTERLRFDGSLADMAAAREAVELPMVCRDVIVDPYQIHEARCYGADVLPLQVEILEQARLAALLDRAESLGMVVMAEVRTPEEADRALQAGASVIAVNSWSFETNSLNRDAFAEIAPGLPSEVIKISLGGVATAKDLMAAAACGADAVLAAEAIMNGGDILAATRKLAAAGQHPACPSRR